MFKINLTIIFITFLTFVNTAKAKVDPPNYDFTFDKFKVFYPGEKLSDIQKTYKNIQLSNKKGSLLLYKVDIIHQRYKFPLFFQVRNGIVIDFYARLPNYFIHDTFHQSLINRFGMQNKFLNKDGTSIYIWTDAKGLVITYSGACTITCFPIFVHGISNKDPKSLRDSFLNKLKDSSKNQIKL